MAIDIKSIVMEQVTKHIEEAMPGVKEGIEQLLIEKIQSKEVEKAWADELNRRINLPFLNESQEQKVFEEIVDKGTDVIAGVIGAMLKKV
jgi:hypothetical protein